MIDKRFIISADDEMDDHFVYKKHGKVLGMTQCVSRRKEITETNEFEAEYQEFIKKLQDGKL